MAEDGEFEQIAQEYRKAFDEVQARLSKIDMGSVPAYVFAIDRFDVKELGKLDAQLAKAEQRRRQWRAALHAMAELEALQGDTPRKEASRVLDTIDPDAPEPGSLENLASGDAGMADLDRFISVVQYARTVGCMYVDGGFRPVFKDSKR